MACAAGYDYSLADQPERGCALAPDGSGYCCPQVMNAPPHRPWPCPDPARRCLLSHPDGWARCSPCVGSPPGPAAPPAAAAAHAPLPAGWQSPGRDWLCARCNIINLADNPACITCGAVNPMDGAMAAAAAAAHAAAEAAAEAAATAAAEAAVMAPELAALDTTPVTKVQVPLTSSNIIRQLSRRRALWQDLFHDDLTLPVLPTGRRQPSRWVQFDVARNAHCLFSAMARALNASLAGPLFEQGVTVAALRNVLAMDITAANWRAKQASYGAYGEVYALARTHHDLRRIVRSTHHFAVPEDLQVLVRQVLAPVHVVPIVLHLDGAAWMDCAIPPPPPAAQASQWYMVLLREADHHYSLATQLPHPELDGDADRAQMLLSPTRVAALTGQHHPPHALRGLFAWHELPAKLRHYYANVCTV